MCSAFTAIFLLLSSFGIFGPILKNTEDIKNILETTPVVKEYEDHSARITLGNRVCIVPAFDSPKDKITCSQ